MAIFDNDLFNFALQLSRDAAHRGMESPTGGHRLLSELADFETERVRERAEQLTEPTREEIEASLERRNREWHEANMHTIEQYQPENEFNPNDNQNFD